MEAGERLEPPSGCYLGFSIDGGVDSLSGLNERLGFECAVLTQFVHFPLTAADIQILDQTAAEMLPFRGLLMITLEPTAGLSSVTQAAADQFGALCAKYEAQGLGGSFVRFAHEMNGPWYAWGQKPALYKEKFRLLAAAVRGKTQRTAMLWAPNDGGGYPYGGNPAPEHFVLLDTNRDGVLTTSDDPYAPYYPGDDVVDWVGLTLYHWGHAYPWGENELPEPRSFADKLTGNYNGFNGDDRGVPDFYAAYCSDQGRRKPMAIAETAAFFNTEDGGAAEFQIKQKWWRQVFAISGDSAEALDIAGHFPKLKLINWLEWRKRESEVQGNVVDWRVTQPLTRDSFVADVTRLKNGRRYFWSAADLRNGGPPDISLPSFEIVSPLRVTPNPAETAQQASFQIAARGVDPLSYEWNFGDGAQASGSHQTHAYAASGAYRVSVTVKDGAKRSQTQELHLSVNTPLSVVRMKAVLRQSKPGRDTLTLDLSLPLRAKPETGTRVEVTVGGVTSKFTLSRNGSARGGNRSRLQLKRLRSAANTRLSATISADIAAAWHTSGVLNPQVELVNLPILVRVEDESFSSAVPARVQQRGATVQIFSLK